MNQSCYLVTNLQIVHYFQQFEFEHFWNNELLKIAGFALKLGTNDFPQPTAWIIIQNSVISDNYYGVGKILRLQYQISNS